MDKFRELTELTESISDDKKLKNAISVMLTAEKRVRKFLTKDELNDYESGEGFYLAYEKLLGYLEKRETNG